MTGARSQRRGRREDVRLLTGRGRFTDDHREASQAHGVFVRSPHAHAEIRSIETARAEASRGVVAVLTASDLTGIGPIPFMRELRARDGSALVQAPRPAMPRNRVRHVGEALARRKVRLRAPGNS